MFVMLGDSVLEYYRLRTRAPSEEVKLIKKGVRRGKVQGAVISYYLQEFPSRLCQEIITVLYFI